MQIDMHGSGNRPKRLLRTLVHPRNPPGGVPSGVPSASGVLPVLAVYAAHVRRGGGAAAACRTKMGAVAVRGVLNSCMECVRETRGNWCGPNERVSRRGRWVDWGRRTMQGEEHVTKSAWQHPLVRGVVGAQGAENIRNESIRQSK